MGSDYWDFSFHEMAKYDIIANINYVKNKTQNEKISYVCHSQGCVQFMIGYTMNPEFFENSVEKVGTMGAVLKYKNFVINIFFILLFYFLSTFIEQIFSKSHKIFQGTRNFRIF